MKRFDLVGKKFGRLTVQKWLDDLSKWQCSCECGSDKVVIVGSYDLTHGKCRSCGCLHSELVSEHSRAKLGGKIFGRLKVLSFHHRDKHNNAVWLCECCCPEHNRVLVTANHLLNGHSKSCGCYKDEIISTCHTKYTTPEVKHLAIRTLGSMRDRCYNPNNKRYSSYGGRGIKVCDEWLNDHRTFADWSLSHGWKPGLTIDRIDVNGNYCPENCRWVDNHVQAGNKRTNRLINIRGTERPLGWWADALNLNRNDLYVKPVDKVVSLLENDVLEKKFADVYDKRT